MSELFTPLRLRDVTLKNRVFVSPMCQYSATDGVPSDWHLVHLGSRAVGGASLVIAEATAVCPEGRISPGDTGLWNDAQERAWQPIARFIAEQGAEPGVQLAHAGRKASTSAPWAGGKPLAADEGAWTVGAPSALPFAAGYPVPHAFTAGEIDGLVERFVAATHRAQRAGFRVIELHMAHGYLLHSFLSPLSNQRDDAYGGTLENRMRAPLAVASAVRDAWPAGLPLLVRISASDWAEGGWDLAQSLVFARELRARGIDLVDCSSGGLVPHAKVEIGPGYQVPFAAAIRREATMATAAVGMITEPQQAEEIVASGQADAVLLARAFLRDPYWPLHAAHALGADIAWPNQYLRAKN